MDPFFLCRVAFVIIFHISSAADWAVLIAGSEGYSNYRHQANICHAYQILKNNGISRDHIITMFVDDIAHNNDNPVKGKIFNLPTKAGTPGKDVYAGCVGDYTGKDVNSDNFKAILTGDSSKAGGKKVLRSTKEDRVFVYYADHGADRNILFPNGDWVDDYDAFATIKKGYQKGLWKQLVWYVEACYAASVFDLFNKYEKDLGAYVATSANAEESAWAAFCPPDGDKVNGIEIGTCLGEVWSSSWMQNTEESDANELLQKQFDVAAAHALANKPAQHPKQLGDLTISHETIGAFMFNKPNRTNSKQLANPSAQSFSTIASWDVDLAVSYYRYIRSDRNDFSTRKKNAENLLQIIRERQAGDQLFEQLARQIWNKRSTNISNMNMHTTGWSELINNPTTGAICDKKCCRSVSLTFRSNCGGFNDYTVQYSKLFINSCILYNNQPEQIMAAIKHIC